MQEIKTLTELIAQYKLEIVLSAFMIFQVFTYSMNSLKNNNKMLQMLDKNNETLAKQIEKSFAGIDNSIIGLYAAIDTRKKIEFDQLQSIVFISMSNTLLMILHRINLIIDRNSLVKNQCLINSEIISYINNYVEEGRKLLDELELDEAVLKSIFKHTDELKEITIQKLHKYFDDAVSELGLINKHKIDAKNKCDVAFLLEIIEQEKEAYSALKRNCFNLVETIRYDLRKTLRELN